MYFEISSYTKVTDMFLILAELWLLQSDSRELDGLRHKQCTVVFALKSIYFYMKTLKI